MILALVVVSITLLAVAAEGLWRWRAKAKILGVLVQHGPTLTSYDIYRRLDRRVGLGVLHTALGELERESLVFLTLSQDEHGARRVVTLRSAPKETIS